MQLVGPPKELSSQLNSKRQLLPDRSNADAEPEDEFQQKAFECI